MDEKRIKREFISEEDKNVREFLKQHNENIRYRDQYHIDVNVEVKDENGKEKKINVVPLHFE